MTRYRRIVAGVSALLLLAVAGCSKTQDTAPETKIFGRPPQINSASIDVSTNHVLCDYTLPFDIYFATSGGLQVTPGPLMIGATYTQFMFHANVSDPEGNSDIILVTASYAFGRPPEETSLVLFDDGSNSTTNPLVYTETGQVPTNCTSTGGQTTCNKATQISLKSNDPVANDGNFTRGFAFLILSTQLDELGGAYARNCIAIQAHQYPQGKAESAPGTTLSFRFDAVDKEGNLTTFPARQLATTGPASFECSGDDCLCCYVRCSTAGLSDPQPNCTPGDPSCCNCVGLPGMIGVGAPAGLCKSF